MTNKFKKIMATVTLGAFAIGVCGPVYANTVMEPVVNFEQVFIEYDTEGALERELCKINDTYYYREIDSEKSVAMAFNEDSCDVQIAVNNFEESGVVESATYILPEESVYLIDETSEEAIMMQFENILSLVEENAIQLSEREIYTTAKADNMETPYVLDAVPSTHVTVLKNYVAAEWTSKPNECTNQLIATKSTTSVRASLYHTVEHEITYLESQALARGLKLVEVLSFFDDLTTSAVNLLFSFSETAGEMILNEDTDVDEYDYIIREAKDVKCNGTVYYDAIKTHLGHGYVSQGDSGLIGYVTFKTPTSSSSYFDDNTAMLDRGIEEYKKYV